ncbi:MAG TPA: DMT family transporter [Thermoleophilia bacterium]|nr:DMT family transporter [Thermoleophilia bacterium]
MPAVAVALALLASLSWGTADFIAGVQSRRSTAWTAALGGQLVASLALIALLLALSPARPSLSTLVPPLVGGAIGGFGVVLQYRALALTDMSVVSPIFAAAALVPVLWGITAGERPGMLQLLGIALTVAGIVVISRGRPEEVGATNTAHDVGIHTRPTPQVPGIQASEASRHAARTGILVAVGATVCFGIFLVCLDYGGAGDPYWTVVVTRTAALVTLGVAAGIARPAIRLTRGAVAPLLVVGLLIATANITFTSATTFGYLSVVAVLGWLGPAITIMWARAVLHERLRPQQIGAAALVFAGVVGLTLG